MLNRPDPVRVLSLCEQGLLSGANFLTLLVLARSFPAQEFGLYSFAYISLQFLANLHRSIVVVPFVIMTAEADSLAREGRLWERLNLAVTGIAMAGLLAAAMIAPLLGAPAWMGRAFIVAISFTGPNFLYEFSRRWAIQLGRYRVVVAAAAVYLAVALGGVAAAVGFGLLDWGIGAYGLANLAAAAVAMPVIWRSRGAGTGLRMGHFLGRLRGFLAWSLLSNLAYNGYYHLPPLILGAMAGPVPVGAYQALRNFIQPVAIVGTAVDNFDKPRAARALMAEGVPAMRRQLARTTRALAMTALPYMALVALLAAPALSLVYADRYSAYGGVLYFWILLSALQIAAYPFETALLLLRRADLLFRGRLAAATVGITGCILAIPRFGVTGAMMGLLAGALGSVLCGSHYLKSASRSETPT